MSKYKRSSYGPNSLSIHLHGCFDEFWIIRRTNAGNRIPLCACAEPLIVREASLITSTGDVIESMRVLVEEGVQESHDGFVSVETMLVQHADDTGYRRSGRRSSHDAGSRHSVVDDPKMTAQGCDVGISSSGFVVVLCRGDFGSNVEVGVDVLFLVIGSREHITEPPTTDLVRKLRSHTEWVAESCSPNGRHPRTGGGKGGIEHLSFFTHCSVIPTRKQNGDPPQRCLHELHIDTLHVRDRKGSLHFAVTHAVYKRHLRRVADVDEPRQKRFLTLVTSPGAPEPRGNISPQSHDVLSVQTSLYSGTSRVWTDHFRDFRLMNELITDEYGHELRQIGSVVILLEKLSDDLAVIRVGADIFHRQVVSLSENFRIDTDVNTVDIGMF